MRVNKTLIWIQTQLALPLIGTLLLAGCASMPFYFGRSPQNFPPQAVMEHGDYAGFIAENRQSLKGCKGKTTCAIALFNLGFAHAYPQSPYYDPAKAQKYLAELIDNYPQTPWAFQGQAWLALVNQTLTLEAARNQLQATLRAQATSIRNLERELKRSRDIDLRIDRIQAALRAQAATIRNLEGRLKRSRDIDLRIDQKERELLR